MNAPAMLNTSGRMSKPIAAVWQQDYTTGRRIEMMRGFFVGMPSAGMPSMVVLGAKDDEQASQT